MRVAFFTETFLPAVDGVVTRLRYTVEQLRAMGDEVMIFAPSGGPKSYAGAEVYSTPGVPFPLYPEKRLAPPHPGLWHALRRFGPDVVHAVNPVVLAAAGVFLARRMELPLVASYHTNIPAYAGHYGFQAFERAAWWYLRTLHNQAQINLCTSRATQSELISQGVDRVEFWPQGVDTDRFRPDRHSPKWRHLLTGGHPERKVLLYVGRLAPEKRLESIRPVVESRADVSFAIVGEGPARKALEREFAGTGTVFTGNLHGEELAAAYAAADVFLFPSTTETLGLVMLEALSSGLPVVAARAGATREVVENGETGLLFDPDDRSSFVRSVARLLDDAELRRVMSRSARVAAEHRDWANATGELRRFYAAACSGAAYSPGRPSGRLV